MNCMARQTAKQDTPMFQILAALFDDPWTEIVHSYICEWRSSFQLDQQGALPSSEWRTHHTGNTVPDIATHFSNPMDDPIHMVTDFIKGYTAALVSSLYVTVSNHQLYNMMFARKYHRVFQLWSTC